MNMLHVTIDGFLGLLILLLPIMDIALGWLLRDGWDRSKRETDEQKD